SNGSTNGAASKSMRLMNRISSKKIQFLPTSLGFAGAQPDKAVAVCAARASIYPQQSPMLIRFIGIVFAGSHNPPDRMSVPLFWSVPPYPRSIGRLHLGGSRGGLEKLKKDNMVWITGRRTIKGFRGMAVARPVEQTRTTNR